MIVVGEEQPRRSEAQQQKKKTLIMFKPKFRNILLYLFVKYCAFFTILAFRENRFKEIVIDNSKNGKDVAMNTLSYVVCVLFSIIILIAIFSVPMCCSFKVRKGIYFVLSVSAILLLEYYFYTWSCSAGNTDGIYNGLMSILFLLLFFYRYIDLKLKLYTYY